MWQNNRRCRSQDHQPLHGPISCCKDTSNQPAIFQFNHKVVAALTPLRVRQKGALSRSLSLFDCTIL
jgi:hypothetical protein